MVLRLIIRPILLLMLFGNISPLIHGQPIHDFDSLYKASKQFKGFVKNIGDTLDLFNSEETLDIIIESDFKNLLKNKHQDDYQPAVIRYMINDSVRISRNIKIKPRGAFRRSTCLYPPIKLNFPKGEVRLKQLEEFDKMKMVSECKNSDTYEQYVLSEYLVYKLYNLFTEYSFRVRLLNVQYVDLGRKSKSYIRHAFIIESVDQLASRLGALEIETKQLGDQFIDRDLSTMMYLFQYLIGNTDWSVPGLHNMKLLKSFDPTVPLLWAIPYDFDYTGMVDAQYAVPHESLGIGSVRERLYMGYCRERGEIDRVLNIFSGKKDAMIDLVEDFDLLSAQNKQRTISYIEGFYRVINSEQALKRDILRVCK